MKLKQLEIRNYRAFSHEKVVFTDYTCLLGANGVGKSAVVSALNLIFSNQRVVQESDYHKRDTSKAIRITLRFEELDATAKNDFAHYVSRDTLTIFAEAPWDVNDCRGKIKIRGIRSGIRDFAECFGMLAANLKPKYKSLQSQTAYAGLPPYSNREQALLALQVFEAANATLCSEIESTEEFYGATGMGQLSKHVKWIHVPAVKDASSEVSEGKNWLGRLLEYAVRSTTGFGPEIDKIEQDANKAYEGVIASKQSTLASFAKKLRDRVREWSNPAAEVDVKWVTNASKPVQVAEPIARVEAGDASFLGDVSLQGHGFQRSYLIALVQMLAEIEGAGPRLLLACEEPELYQHPPQAQYLAGLLKRVAATSAQVLVCTHSPYFATGDDVDSIRLVRRGAGGASSIVVSGALAVATKLHSLGRKAPPTASGSRARLHQLLQPAATELFFARTVVLVEGLEDQAYLTAQLHIDGREADFRRLGCHIVHCDGKDRLVTMLAIASCYGIPAFAVFDGDRETCVADVGPESEKMRTMRSRHEPDNRAIMTLSNAVASDPFPAIDVYDTKMVCWRNNISDSVVRVVGEAAVRAAQETIRQEYGLSSEPALEKNGLFIGLWMDQLKRDGHVANCLKVACDRILDFANQVASTA